MQLNQKETSYLKDAASQEQLCLSLYQQYSQKVQDPQLAQILQTIAQQEQQHLQTIKQLQQGQVPNTQSGQQGGGQQQGFMGQQGGGPTGGGMQMQNLAAGGAQMGGQASQQSPDKQVCEELLSIEKAVSDLYDHAVFEFTNQQARKTLEHIQQEEHDHGFMLWQYMNQQGWYQTQ
ncbi:MAG: spore coat protein [Bacillota bacterium]|jgi:rubrerythrin